MNRLVRIACFPARLVRSWRDARAVVADAEHGPDKANAEWERIMRAYWEDGL